jgi:hypothetical protein
MRKKAKPLDDVFQVLSGTREPKFLFEPELRLFQFRVWLLSEGNTDKCLSNSAVLFTSLMLKRRIQLDRYRQRDAKPSELVIAVFEKERYCDLYDVAFPSPLTPYSLSLKLSLKDLKREFQESREAVAHLNQLTEIRLRLHASEDYSFSLNEARDIYAKINAGKRTGFSRTNLSPVRKKRQAREAFLFVAQQYDPAFLKFETKALRLPRELHEEAADKDRFRKLFSRAITALQILKPKGLTAERLHECIKSEPMPLDVIRPFKKADFEQVGYHPKLRRAAAKEIHTGKRQRPAR